MLPTLKLPPSLIESIGVSVNSLSKERKNENLIFFIFFNNKEI